MRLVPVTSAIAANSDVNSFARANSASVGILSIASDGVHSSLIIADRSVSAAVKPQIIYCVATADNKSGHTAHKVSSFPESEEERQGNALNWRVKLGDDSMHMRVAGHAVNAETAELIFAFSAYSTEKGWQVTINDYIDRGGRYGSE